MTTRHPLRWVVQHAAVQASASVKETNVPPRPAARSLRRANGRQSSRMFPSRKPSRLWNKSVHWFLNTKRRSGARVSGGPRTATTTRVCVGAFIDARSGAQQTPSAKLRCVSQKIRSTTGPWNAVTRRMLITMSATRGADYRKTWYTLQRHPANEECRLVK